MWWRLVLVDVGLLAAGFMHGPIQWMKFPTRGYVLAPTFPLRSPPRLLDLAPPQKLTVRLQSDHFHPATLPVFTANRDETITWDAMGWCVEATGDKSGDELHVNQCTGRPNQLWTLLPRKNQIQLKGTNQCVNVAEQEGDLNRAPVELHECEHSASESWEFVHVGSRATELLPPLLRHVLISCIACVTFLVLGLSARFWRRQTIVSCPQQLVSNSFGTHLCEERGGVTLTPRMWQEGQKVQDVAPKSARGISLTPIPFKGHSRQESNTKETQCEDAVGQGEDTLSMASLFEKLEVGCIDFSKVVSFKRTFYPGVLGLSIDFASESVAAVQKKSQASELGIKKEWHQNARELLQRGDILMKSVQENVETAKQDVRKLAAQLAHSNIGATLDSTVNGSSMEADEVVSRMDIGGFLSADVFPKRRAPEIMMSDVRTANFLSAAPMAEISTVAEVVNSANSYFILEAVGYVLPAASYVFGRMDDIERLFAKMVLLDDIGAALVLFCSTLIFAALRAEKTVLKEFFNKKNYWIYAEDGTLIDHSGKFISHRRKLVADLDRISDAWQDVSSSLAWSNYFRGAFLPVEPRENVMMTVKSGQLPDDFSGAYMRVAPNSPFWPPTKRTTVFDGDGMVHSVRFSHGVATYHCKYLETPRHQFEQQWGAEWFSRVGEMQGRTGLAKVIASVEKNALAGLEDWEVGTANTAIAYSPDGKLWALNEVGAPFRFRLDGHGKADSVGIDTLDGTHENPMSAHPKIDQRTGEVFFHGRELLKDMYVARAVDGKVIDRVVLDVSTGFHHDMFITENFVVIVDGSTRLNHAGLVSDEALLQFNPNIKLRFGVFRRSIGRMTAEAFEWIEAPMAAEVVHTLYAYDEGDKINLWAPLCFFKDNADDGALGVLGGQGPPHMHRLVIDVEEKCVDVELVNGGDLHRSEFPRIRDDRIGLRTQYGYSALQSPGVGEDFNFTGILKWDFSANRLAGAIQFPEDVVGGEPVFIPSASSSSTSETKDDDGYIGMFLWNYVKEESTYALFDAQSFASEPVVELVVPRRVPMGFHAAWLTEDQFQKQLHAP